VRRFRDQHYLFAHEYLPFLLWKEGSLLDDLADPSNQDFLTEAWEDAGTWTKGTERVDPAGLSYGPFSIRGLDVGYLIRLPQPKRPPEAFFVAIIASPTIRYFTLERSKGGNDPLVFFCERTRQGRHLNLRELHTAAPTETAFLALIRESVGALR